MPMFRWLDERLDLRRFHEKFLRKVFPVHHSFYLGEIALFAFVTLVATGAYLTLSYEPSSHEMQVAGRSVPACYASVLYIDSLPLGRLLRSVHHWSAHVMIAAAFLHLLRILLSGAYKNPREINWLIGLALLGLAMVTAFTGYSLPNDAFSVTATKIGYGLATAVPYVGRWMAQVMFGGEYPSAHSIPRLYAAHVLWLPAALLGLVVGHLLVMVKQKHVQAPYARAIAPGRILGIPLMPHQALTSGILFLLFLAVVFAIGGALTAHPIDAFGPPGISTPNVKPDWYFLWVYGVLELMPSSWVFPLPGGAVVGPELLGMCIPALLVAWAVLLPFLDRKATKLRYLELPSHHPARTAAAGAVVAFMVSASLAGYRDELGLSIGGARLLALLAPLLVAAAIYSCAHVVRRRAASTSLGPTAERS